MIETIDEQVRVFVDFNVANPSSHGGARVRPVAFLYGGRKYVLERVNLVSEAGLGPTKRFLFSVSDMANTFTLEYNPFNLSWQLRDMYTEG